MLSQHIIASVLRNVIKLHKDRNELPRLLILREVSVLRQLENSDKSLFHVQRGNREFDFL